jgi:hypothetical protein
MEYLLAALDTNCRNEEVIDMSGFSQFRDVKKGLPLPLWLERLSSITTWWYNQSAEAARREPMDSLAAIYC